MEYYIAIVVLSLFFIVACVLNCSANKKRDKEIQTVKNEIKSEIYVRTIAINKTIDTLEKKAESYFESLNSQIKKNEEEQQIKLSEVSDSINSVEHKMRGYIDQKAEKAKDDTDKIYSSFAHYKANNDKTIESLTNHIELLIAENDKINAELENLRKELNFYANIEEDSGKLNEKEDVEERKRLLDLARVQILDESKKQNETGDTQAQKYELTNYDNYDVDTQESKDTSKAVLDEEQGAACSFMERGKENVFVTGKAGTGKSFLLDAFRSRTTQNYIVMAPTGIAALNVNGATLHSTFGYQNLVNLDVDDISSETIKLKSEKRMVLKNVQTIIIDEISMVRADTFDKIDRILKVINNNDLPFGGKQMLVFGDLFQLPPVTKSGEFDYLYDRYGGVYFFNSDAFKNGSFKFIELTINHRQKGDNVFFEILNRIREGHVLPSDIEALNSRVSNDNLTFERYTTLLPTKREAEITNKNQLSKLKGPEMSYSAVVMMDKHPDKTKTIDNIFPVVSPLKLKKGALIMMVANDPEKRWVNGTLGIVNKLNESSIFVSIDQRTYEVLPTVFTEQEITYRNGKITYEDVYSISQFPIVPAYAMTIHKSQGQTYKNIVCDIDSCFASGQAYVALSRCSSLNGLHLKSKISQTSIKVDSVVLDFYRNNINKTM